MPPRFGFCFMCSSCSHEKPMAQCAQIVSGKPHGRQARRYLRLLCDDCVEAGVTIGPKGRVIRPDAREVRGVPRYAAVMPVAEVGA